MIERYLDQPIAYHREFVDLGVGVTGALMLSRVVYWTKRSPRTGGWFRRTHDVWTKETGMTRHQIDTARRKLVAAGVMDYKAAGLPCTMHFRARLPEIEQFLEARR